MSAYSDAVLATTGLVNYWKLNGSTADLKGSALLTYGPSTVISAGRVIGDYATKFDKTSSSYVFVNPPALSGAHSFELIFKVPAGTIPNGYWIFGTRGSVSTSRATELLFQSTNNGSIYLIIGNGSSSYAIPTNFGSNLALDTWHHIILAVGADGSYQVFFDGASLGTGIWNLTGTPLVFDATANLTIGDYNRSLDPNWLFSGSMQHFAVYNTKLDLATAQAHVAALGDTPVVSYLASMVASVVLQRNWVAGKFSGSAARPAKVSTTASPVHTVRGAMAPGVDWNFPAPYAIHPLDLGSGGGSGPRPRPTSGQVWPR